MAFEEWLHDNTVAIYDKVSVICEGNRVAFAGETDNGHLTKSTYNTAC